MLIPIKSKRLEAAQAWLYDHPRVSLLIVLCVVLFVLLPQWGSAVWQLFTDKPFFVWLSERMRTMEFSGYWITVPIGVLAFLFMAYLLLTGRRGTQSTESQPDEASTIEEVEKIPASEVEKLEGRIKELEDEKATLETARKEDAKRINDAVSNNTNTYQYLQSVKSELSALKIQYKWLHEMAEAQAKDIGSYVIVERVRFCYHEFIAPIPYLIFAVDIRNKSVFDITIEDEMKGHIKIAGERLLGEKELIDNPKISPSGMKSLIIKQRLSPTEINLVAVCEKEPLGAFYYFDKLEIMIAARTELPYFDRTPLNLPQHISSKDDEVAQLKNELASLHRRSETIVKLNLALGGAYTLANLFEAGEPPSKERIEHWFNSTLRGHIHPDDLEALCEGLPELTDIPTEQKDLIDKYCFNLRRLIREQRQKQ